jgi:dihydrofolate synthase / folylpolyglutamate synthase
LRIDLTKQIQNFTFQQAQKWLFDLDPFGIKLGLDRMTELAGVLGNPHTQFHSIHIAGTNGKGSVAAMLESYFLASGYRTGMYTSPHLVDARERVRVNGEMITRKEFTAIAGGIHRFVTELNCTFFEAITALAFEYFAQKQVEVAIIEVGLGGRLDATNIIEPQVSVLTTIDFDHEEYLGHTLANIASEKAGIIKPGVPCVIGRLHREAENVIEEKCLKLGCDLYKALDCCQVSDIKQASSGTEFKIIFNGEKIALKVNLPGIHQVDNACTALTAIKAFDRHGSSFDAGIWRSALRNIQWPGRFQVIKKDPLIVADVAHNAASIRQFCEMVRTFFNGYNIILVFGVVSDKDYQEIIKILVPLDALFVPVQAQNKRALPVGLLKNELERYGCPYISVQSIQEGIKSALRHTGVKTVICLTGSHYVVGEAIIEIKNLTKKIKLFNLSKPA